MQFMMPITDKKDIQAMADWLKGRNERDYVLFMSGIYLGRRISDILKYRVGDLKNKEFIEIPEEKTGKIVHLRINPYLRKIYKHYFRDKQNYEYVFRRERGKENKPIGRNRAWQIINQAARAVEYGQRIGCHTLRKTFAYWLYKDNDNNIAMVQDLLGHADPSITMRYIGIDQEIKDRAIDSLYLGG